MKNLLLSIFLLISASGFSQEADTLNVQNWQQGIDAGLNYSKFRIDTADFSYCTRPAIGYYWKYKYSKEIYLKGTVLFSEKASVSTWPYAKLVNDYLDFNFLSQYRFDDLFIQAGVNFSGLLSSKRIIVGDNWKGVRRINNRGYNSEVHFLAGLELKLQKNISIDLNYNFPVSKSKIQNFQLTLNIMLNSNDPKTESERIIRQKIAKEQINQLKNGTLLVRLHTSDNKINVLMKAGKIENANKTIERQYAENRRIVSAFRNNFTFCKYAFFYSYNSGKIKEGKFENVFLDDNLSIDSTITVDTNMPVFTAEFGPIEQDTVKRFDYYDYVPDADWSVKKVPRYYSSSTTSFIYALVIKDMNFEQLQKPFPYYTRAVCMSIRRHPEQAVFIFPELIFLPKTYGNTVAKMNKKLTKYYNHNHY